MPLMEYYPFTALRIKVFLTVFLKKISRQLFVYANKGYNYIMNYSVF